MKKVKFFSFWLFLSLCAATTVFNSYGQSSTSDKGVVINGVKWATRNVAAPGTFATTPEDVGRFYQWNRKKAWATTRDVAHWDDTYPEGTEWEATNDPSPDGWRVPTLAEINTLFSVKVRCEWTTRNGKYGIKFTDKDTGNTLFLPVTGYRNSFNYGSLVASASGYYWSSTANGGYAYSLGFSNNYGFSAGSRDRNYRKDGFCVRAVATTENKSGSATFKATVPASTPETAFVSIVGNWGSIAPEWTPGAVVMQRQSDGTYILTKNVPARFEYKYAVSVDGVTWSRDYLDDVGDNRKMSVNLRANDVVESWRNEPWINSEDWVLINGVKWATRNVNAPGTFAANREDAGMFYQSNRKKEWPTTGTVTGWSSIHILSDTWEKSNDPSPAGYRVPTLTEIQSLLNTTYVSNEWTITPNGIYGRKFTDKTTGNTLFLPAVGYRLDDGTLHDIGTDGYYWGNAQRSSALAHYLSFGSGLVSWGGDGDRRRGFCVRSVAE